MTHRFTRRFRVRHYELDAYGHVKGVNLVRYMQEAAIEASTALGFSPEWYRQHGVGWVVRRLSVRHFTPALYGDEIEVGTWLSVLRGVRSLREYDLRRGRDGVQVARGRAEWVYMDFQSGQPTRVPDAWADAFVSNKPEDLGIRLSNARSIVDAPRYTSRRRVQFHELDTVQHVNHAVYLQWITQAILDRTRRAGSVSDGTSAVADASGSLVGHEIQYFAAALEEENIEIVSWLTETSADGAAWTHEIYNANTRKLLARDYARHQSVG
ncbi:MAG: acyl-[acyl-carrier-protein] thioesterase [Gemmataceae bacterium]